MGLTAAKADPSTLANAFSAAGEGRYRLAAPLTFATVPALQARGTALIQQGGGALVIDLSGISTADSAGLALLVDWLAEARARGGSLRYEQIPETLHALARLSEVDTLIAPAA